MTADCLTSFLFHSGVVKGERIPSSSEIGLFCWMHGSLTYVTCRVQELVMAQVAAPTTIPCSGSA